MTIRKDLSSTRKSFLDTVGEKDCSVPYFLRSAGRWLSGSKEQEMISLGTPEISRNTLGNLHFLFGFTV